MAPGVVLGFPTAPDVSSDAPFAQDSKSVTWVRYPRSWAVALHTGAAKDIILHCDTGAGT